MKKYRIQIATNGQLLRFERDLSDAQLEGIQTDIQSVLEGDEPTLTLYFGQPPNVSVVMMGEEAALSAAFSIEPIDD